MDADRMDDGIEVPHVAVSGEAGEDMTARVVITADIGMMYAAALEHSRIFDPETLMKVLERMAGAAAGPSKAEEEDAPTCEIVDTTSRPAFERGEIRNEYRLSCGHVVGGQKPAYCPFCGARVVGGNE